jgi:hypothetical protein
MYIVCKRRTFEKGQVKNFSRREKLALFLYKKNKTPRNQNCGKFGATQHILAHRCTQGEGGRG